MTGQRWTLKERLARWLVFAICAQALIVIVPAGFFLYSSLDRELGSLLEEELAEFGHGFQSASLNKGRAHEEMFEEIAIGLNLKHHEYPLAWALWSEGLLVKKVGQESLAKCFDTVPTKLDSRQDIARMGAWRAMQLKSGEIVAVAVDGSAQRGVLLRFISVVGGLLALCVVGAVMGGLTLGRRTSELLEGVAAQTRGVGTTGSAKGISIVQDGLPEEIRSVAVALQEAMDRLERETSQYRLLTAGLAHELRSPIQNLMGEIEVTLRQDRDAPRYRKVLESNLDEVRDLGEAVDNLMLLCTSRGVGEDLHHEEFDIGFEAEVRLAGEISQARRRGVTVTMTVESTGTSGTGHAQVLICADREAILRVLRNLVANAVEWTPTGGAVQVSILASADEVKMTVDDSGPGIPIDQREGIFEPFARGSAPGGERVGYGLGLAIVQTAVISHGGTVTIGTSPMGGARMTVVIPRGLF